MRFLMFFCYTFICLLFSSCFPYVSKGVLLYEMFSLLTHHLCAKKERICIKFMVGDHQVLIIQSFSRSHLIFFFQIQLLLFFGDIVSC